MLRVIGFACAVAATVLAAAYEEGQWPVVVLLAVPAIGFGVWDVMVFRRSRRRS